MLDTSAKSIPNSRSRNKVLTHFLVLTQPCWSNLCYT